MTIYFNCLSIVDSSSLDNAYMQSNVREKPEPTPS